MQKYDVIISGTGVAGLYAACCFSPEVKVLLLSKREPELSNSSLAQGGVAAVFDKNHDDYKLHIADTLIAGAYKNNLQALEILVKEGPDDVSKIINMGVRFDDDGKGHLDMTLEGGHSRRRILHYKDQTGYEIVRVLLQEAKSRENITIVENGMLTYLKPLENGFQIGVLSDEEPVNYICRFCILATGGIGRVYSYTTNSAIATGDGIYLAYKLGAEVNNLSLIQFHPTAFAAENDRERFLISESVRGEGAVLLNHKDERFMFRYDERGELAPRDVVSRSIILESRRTGSQRFYLDISFKDKEYLKDRFPTIYSRCLSEGIDITKDRIPIFPCQHYLMGGIEVDTNGRTTIDRLYAVGECSHTGVHGMNRLASNSLLEALVFSRRAVVDIQARLAEGREEINGEISDWVVVGNKLPKGIKTEIRGIMQKAFFVIPNREEAVKGYKRCREIREYLESGNFSTTRAFCETISLVTIAELILREVCEKNDWELFG